MEKITLYYDNESDDISNYLDDIVYEFMMENETTLWSKPLDEIEKHITNIMKNVSIISYNHDKLYGDKL